MNVEYRMLETLQTLVGIIRNMGAPSLPPMSISSTWSRDQWGEGRYVADRPSARISEQRRRVLSTGARALSHLFVSRTVRKLHACRYNNIWQRVMIRHRRPRPFWVSLIPRLTRTLVAGQPAHTRYRRRRFFLLENYLVPPHDDFASFGYGTQLHHIRSTYRKAIGG